MRFLLPDGRLLEGSFTVRAKEGLVLLEDFSGKEIIRQKEILLSPDGNAGFTVADVKIGINFHWQRSQKQTFRGDLLLYAVSGSSFNLINKILLEDYLESVISSEMSAEAPLEFLKAQAITARSWLTTMLSKKKVARFSPANLKLKMKLSSGRMSTITKDSMSAPTITASGIREQQESFLKMFMKR